ERFVRDHPGATLAMAATRPLRTISTFTIWRSAREMSEMVHGRQEGGGANRHAAAMVEHRRQDLHLEFTTLRLACMSEHGAWDGRSSCVPVEREVPLPQGPLTASARLEKRSGPLGNRPGGRGIAPLPPPVRHSPWGTHIFARRC